MIVVNILGGFGNQLSTYACAYSVAQELGEKLVLDVSDYFCGYFRPYALDELNIPEHLKVYYPHKAENYHGIFGAPLNFMLIFDEIIDTNEIKTREELIEKVSGKKNVYIQGYSGLKFVAEEHKRELKQLFRLRNGRSLFQEKISKIASQNSVSIHIRRTDFINNSWDMETNYYKAAIVYMEKMLGDIEFYIFSDDIEWAKDNLGYRTNYHYVNILGGMEADIEELYCMSACKHHILTNRSTFGHWAAFLAPREEGINIINGEDAIIEVSNKHVLDSNTISELSSVYVSSREEVQKIDLEYLEQCLMDNRNLEVIDYIDNLSLEAWSLTKEIKEILLEYKGIAYLQEEADAKTALSIFNSLQQTRRDDIDFCFNYAVALMKAGCRIESLVYSGRVLQMNEAVDVTTYLGELNELEKEILELVKNAPQKHYVFLNLSIYENVKGYYEAMAILLRNLGNKVTILEFGNEEIVSDGVEFSESIKEILATEEHLDKVYNWDLTKYKIGKINEPNYFTKIVEVLFGNCEEIIFVTHYVQGVVAKDTNYPLFFMDSISEWDVKKNLMNKYDDVMWNEIYGSVTGIITNRDIPAEFENIRVNPYVGACMVEGNDVFSHKERLVYPGFYMRNEECIWGVLSLLKCTLELS